VLLDCGLSQGLKELRLRNWSPPPIDVDTLGGIVLTHTRILMGQDLKHLAKHERCQ
jgi:metallo-beta-lactamase family protein